MTFGPRARPPHAIASSIALATFVRSWLFRVIPNGSQPQRATLHQAQTASVQDLRHQPVP